MLHIACTHQDGGLAHHEASLEAVTVDALAQTI